MKTHVIAAAMTAFLAAGGSSFAQTPGEPAADGAIEVIKVQGNVWLIGGAGANIAVQAGDQGVIVVDTGAAAMSDKVIAAIRSISTRPIRYIINTSMAPQHVGGNAALAVLPGGSTTGATQGAVPNVIAQENVYTRMTKLGPDGKPAFPADAWPSDGYFSPRRRMIFNGEAIDIIHMPKATSDGDSIVYFRGSNVLVAGDIFTTTNLPIVNRALGGSYAGVLSALDAMLDIGVPDDLMEAGTYIIPGHGRVCDEADLVEYRDMVYQIRDRLKKLAGEGKTLAQVKAAHPVLGWEGRYSRPEWTADMFLEAIYPEFAAVPRPAPAPQKKPRPMMRGAFVITSLIALAVPGAMAQQAPAPAAGQVSLFQRYAPIDLTGTWVSIVTEDWAVRMLAPPKGNFESLPLTKAAQEAANRVDLAQVEASGRSCDAYGAPVVMREPGRVRFSWQDGNTLKVETDAGEQTRLFHFGTAPDVARGMPGRQGFSVAEWQYANGFDPIRAAEAPAGGGNRGGGGARGGGGGGGGFGRNPAATAPAGGKLKVTTTNLTPGFLRKNGVPYSARTVVTEYHNLFTEPGGTQWFVVTTVVHDPENLVVDFITSTNFRKEPDNSKWHPTACSLR